MQSRYRVFTFSHSTEDLFVFLPIGLITNLIKTYIEQSLKENSPSRHSSGPARSTKVRLQKAAFNISKKQPLTFQQVLDWVCFSQTPALPQASSFLLLAALARLEYVCVV